MIKVKHFLEAVEPDDGQRIWVEPVGLTRDLREWCKVTHILPHLGPPRELANWFEAHPDGYEFFRGRYHECLRHGPYRAVLQQIAVASRRDSITLLHQGDHPEHNAAAALYEFIVELEAYCPPGAGDDE
jgi:uncharacterized protein YeaO (DUF488 family)